MNEISNDNNDNGSDFEVGDDDNDVEGSTADDTAEN